MTIQIESFLDLPYSDLDDRCCVDIFRPSTKDILPLVIMVHGGGWLGGDRTQFHQLAIALAKENYAVASVGYRLLTDVNAIDLCNDVLQGLQYLESNKNAYLMDTSKTVIAGSSAGGHLSLVMHAKASKMVEDPRSIPNLLGAVAHCPVTNVGKFIKNKEKFENSGIENYSPHEYPEEEFRNLLIVHGDADITVAHEDSQYFVQRLLDKSIPCQFETLVGVDHAFAYNISMPNGIKSLELMKVYLHSLLKE